VPGEGARIRRRGSPFNRSSHKVLGRPTATTAVSCGPRSSAPLKWRPLFGVMRSAHGHGALRIVALRDSRQPGLVATSGQTRRPPARRLAAPAHTHAEHRRTAHRCQQPAARNSQPRATDSHPRHHDVPRHEPTLIAAVRSRTTAGSRCGTFSGAGLTADRTLSNVSLAANERSSKLPR